MIAFAIFIFNKEEIKEENIGLSQIENFIREPKLYGRLGEIYIEIAAADGNKIDNNIELRQIEANLYREKQQLLIKLSTNSGIFHINSNRLTIDKPLVVEGKNFTLKAMSCEMEIDSGLALFKKVTIDIV
jgi:hypothetical protein